MRMLTISHFDNDSLILVLQFIGQPIDFLHMLTVCKEWYGKFDSKDAQLWINISKVYEVSIHSYPGSSSSSRSSSHSGRTRSLRSAADFKRLFIKSYFRHLADLDDRHDQLIIQSKALLSNKRDQPKKLQKLIESLFINMRGFNVDYCCPTMEGNSLLTLACRYQQKNCLRMLVETHQALVNIADMGGFTPLILAAFQGSFCNVVYLLKKGADWRLRGRLRSGPLLIAEHWAAIKGHLEIFRYLHSIRGCFARSRKLVKELTMTTTPDGATNSHSSYVASNRALLLLPRSLDHELQDRTPLARSTSDAESSMLDNKGSPTATSNALARVDTNNTRFCFCGEGFTGNMVACDGANCPIEWFHYDCVGLLSKPLSSWYCPTCFLSNDCSTCQVKPPGRSLVSASLSTSTDDRYPGNGNISNNSKGDDEDDNDVDDEGYCICGRGFDSSPMVACDAVQGCLIEWYHFECVGLTTAPVDRWLCPLCRGTAFPSPEVKSSSNSSSSSASCASSPDKRRQRRKGCKRSLDQSSPRKGKAPLLLSNNNTTVSPLL